MSPDEQERRRSRTVHFTDKLAGKMAEGVSLFTLEARRVLVSLDSAGTAVLRGPTALDFMVSRGAPVSPPCLISVWPSLSV
jgi:hypothetical protein